MNNTPFIPERYDIFRQSMKDNILNLERVGWNKTYKEATVMARLLQDKDPEGMYLVACIKEEEDSNDTCNN